MPAKEMKKLLTSIHQFQATFSSKLNKEGDQNSQG